MSEDLTLLRDYSRCKSEKAFATLVSRYVNLVYSVALRQVRDPHLAEEITQAVFLILARKADSLGDGTILGGWLCRTARNVSANALKIQRRRQRREQEAHMQSTVNDTDETASDQTWDQIAPLLDDALAQLGKKDHDAVVLRFFQGRNFKEVGAKIGVTEDAAKMRVSRALEKLRVFFLKRGVASTTMALATLISANSVQSAPVALASSVSAIGIAKDAAISTSVLTLTKGALNIMAWTKVKAGVIAGICVLLAAGSATVVIERRVEAKAEKLWRINKDIPRDRIDRLPSIVKIIPTEFTSQWVNWNAGSDGKWVGANARLKVVAACAYGIPLGRTRFSFTEPTNRFDFIATLPQGSRAALQGELKKKFGLVGRIITEEQDVLLLKAHHTGAPGLKPAFIGKSDAYMKEGAFHTSDAPLGIGDGFQGLATHLESYFRKPVVDQTGIPGSFRMDLRWQEVKYRDNPEGLKRALLDELGLELVPARMPIEILVVDKVGK